MTKYIVVYIDAGRSYLAEWMPGSGMYESVSEGKPVALKKLAKELNGEANG